MIRMTCLTLSVLASLVIAHGQTLDATLPASQPESQPTTRAFCDAGFQPALAQAGSLHHKEAPSVRFSALDVYVDSGNQPLAAYQCEITASHGDVKIVGIEGGEHAAFKNPPYYDPAALMNNRVILAAFNTGANLPTGKSRIARVHVRIGGDTKPQYELKLTTAGGPDGQRIDAKISTD